MPKRTRERQLAKLAARRQAERARQKRRRSLGMGIGGALAGVLLLFVGFKLLTGSDSSAAASITPTATISPTPSAGQSPCGSPEPPASATEKKPTFKDPPPMTIDVSKTYTATFETTCGTFTTELLAKEAPQAVNSFVFLANQGFYDGLTFHRIVQGFVVQAGDPKGDGTGGPGYETPVTVSEGRSFDAAGLLAFAHTSSGGNGSQFFVTLAPAPNLDPSASGKYTIFGDVTKGLNVVQKIGSVPTVTGPACPEGESCSPTEPVFILTVTIHES